MAERQSPQCSRLSAMMTAGHSAAHAGLAALSTSPNSHSNAGPDAVPGSPSRLAPASPSRLAPPSAGGCGLAVGSPTRKVGLGTVLEIAADGAGPAAAAANAVSGSPRSPASPCVFASSLTLVPSPSHKTGLGVLAESPRHISRASLTSTPPSLFANGSHSDEAAFQGLAQPPGVIRAAAAAAIAANANAQPPVSLPFPPPARSTQPSSTQSSTSATTATTTAAAAPVPDVIAAAAAAALEAARVYAAQTPAAKGVDPNRPITMAEVERNRRWLVIDGKVYDLTAFLRRHPGGEEILIENMGRDASQVFKEVGHSKKARDLLPDLQVGILSKE
eukprot:m.61099 g.61099  ORF g.61099 m.61099 type:complete len:333 (+) comp13710_c0_seq1:61-1059(+)